MTPETVTLILLAVTSITGLITTIALFVSLSRTLAAIGNLERQATQEARTTTTRLDGLTTTLTERPSTTVMRELIREDQTVRTSALAETLLAIGERATREEVRDIVTRAYEDIYLPKLRDELRALLPADVTPALVLETLERIGVRIPDPAPVLPDEVLVERVKKWAIEGVIQAEQAAKTSPSLTSLDKFRIAQTYVLERLNEERLEFPLRRLAQAIEEAVWHVHHVGT